MMLQIEHGDKSSLICTKHECEAQTHRNQLYLSPKTHTQVRTNELIQGKWLLHCSIHEQVNVTCN